MSTTTDLEVYRKFRERVALLVNEEQEKGTHAAAVAAPNDYDLAFMQRWLALCGLKIVSGLTHFNCSCSVPHVVVCDSTFPAHIHCANCSFSGSENSNCRLCSK